jgi:head-tail adaptor
MRAGRLRSRAVIRRPTETRGPLGSVETTYPQVGMAWVDVRVPRRMIANYGAGELPTGTMEAELRDRIDLRMRDVLEIVAGPETGTRWRVISPPHRPGRGELLVLLEVFNDPLTEEGTGL